MTIDFTEDVIPQCVLTLAELFSPATLQGAYTAIEKSRDKYREELESETCSKDVAITYAKALAARSDSDTEERLTEALTQYPEVIVRCIKVRALRQTWPVDQADIFLIGNNTVKRYEYVIAAHEHTLVRLERFGARPAQRANNNTQTPVFIDRYEEEQIIWLGDDGCRWVD